MKNCAVLFGLFLFTLTSCSETDTQDSIESEVQSEGENEVENYFSASLRELSDEEYPDNPDITVRHEKCVETTMKSIEFIRKGELFDVYVIPDNTDDDTAHLFEIDLMEFIPTIPEYARDDEYLSLIAIVNQEWNRNQVKWQDDQLKTASHEENCVVNGEKVARLDLARNCLNSYLWEVFLYTDVNGSNENFYHGWFDFPKDLYHELFAKRNNKQFDEVADFLENWQNPPSKKINLSKLRSIISQSAPRYADLSNEMYPISGERKKKQIGVITPTEVTKMSDFHTDASTFATFTPPGFYNRSDPRTTELGRFKKLEGVIYRTTQTPLGEHSEFHLNYSDDQARKTQLVIGGLDLSTLPRLSTDEANSGHQFSMGIGNHPFYEDYALHENKCSLTNPYFGVLLDENGNWLDSHYVGIDGPLLHLDKDDPNILHIWILSFERHALVAHYVLDLSAPATS
ncbi:MAG: hypothetical protein AB8B56_11935 [Crocinitomicaceae bacterium]